MTTAERKQNELAQLIAERRVVRAEMQAQHATVTARVDMPEYGIKAGETFHLVMSSFEGYAYIVKWDQVWTKHACGCKGYEWKHYCKHTDNVNAVCKSRFHQQRPTPARQQETWGDDQMTPEERTWFEGDWEKVLEPVVAVEEKKPGAKLRSILSPASEPKRGMLNASLNGQERKIEYPFGRAVFMR